MCLPIVVVIMLSICLSIKINQIKEFDEHLENKFTPLITEHPDVQ